MSIKTKYKHPIPTARTAIDIGSKQRPKCVVMDLPGAKPPCVESVPSPLFDFIIVIQRGEFKMEGVDRE